MLFRSMWGTKSGVQFSLSLIALKALPVLLRAAYNYQYVQKDPGAFAHNGQYVIQVLYDTLVDLNANVSGMTRPVVAVPEG